MPPGSTGAAAHARAGALSYVLSFVNVGIYWNNHHHLLKTVERVSGSGALGEPHLLFWLSLLPVVDQLDGREPRSRRSPSPSTASCSLPRARATTCSSRAIIAAAPGDESLLESAIGRDPKGVASVVLYAVRIALCAVSRWAAVAIYVVVAVMWLVPDRRLATTIEQAVSDDAADA